MTPDKQGGGRLSLQLNLQIFSVKTEQNRENEQLIGPHPKQHPDTPCASPIQRGRASHYSSTIYTTSHTIYDNTIHDRGALMNTHDAWETVTCICITCQPSSAA